MKDEKVISVFGPDGRFLSKTTKQRAEKLLDTERAIVLSHDSIKIRFSKNMHKKIRHRIIEDEQRICYICGERIPDNEIATVDHVVPKSRDDRAFDPSNMRCCCVRCNKDKKNMTLTEYIDFVRDNRLSHRYLSNARLKNLERFANAYERKFYSRKKGRRSV